MKKMLIPLLLAISFISFISAAPNDGYGMWGMMSGSYGLGMGIFGWVFAVLVFVLLVLLIVWLIKQIQKT